MKGGMEILAGEITQRLEDWSPPGARGHLGDGVPGKGVLRRDGVAWEKESLEGESYEGGHLEDGGPWERGLSRDWGPWEGGHGSPREWSAQEGWGYL